MLVAPMTADNQPAALAYLRASPYRNALPLSNATQLRARCDVLVAMDGARVVGVASTYHDLPLSNLTFVARADNAAAELLHALADRNPRLRAGSSIALLPAERRDQLARHVAILGAETEYQMVAEPETLRDRGAHQPRRLSTAELPAMDALARAAGLNSWHAGALALGPAFGCFAGERLVAMAGTHFATPEVVEIGFVATHPEARRQGYASACVAALTRAAFGLAPRVFLMVLEDNQPAVAAYKKLGFRTFDRMYLVRFQL